jgi:hypothetical protein
MAVTPKVCMLTIHGIGFQQRPLPGIPGYADVLHENLGEALGGKLGNDPKRQPETRGPVYVMSARPGTHDTEWGLSRLGTWRDGGLDVTGMPLAEAGKPIAHVALIYTSLEDVGPLLGTGTGTVSEAGLLLGQYASVAGAMRLVCGDAWAALHEQPGQARQQPSPSLRPRTDLAAAHRFSVRRFLHPGLTPSGAPGGGLLPTVMALEDDVVAYVCRNDLRESIRAFIREAMRRLAARPDVRGVVVNAHSQGTVASFDVLQQGQDLTPGVTALVTAGSPLRKYADLFSWGSDVGAAASVGRWLNFWDAKDPVADPLDQPATWHYGNPAVPRHPDRLGLFWTAGDDGTARSTTLRTARAAGCRRTTTGTTRPSSSRNSPQRWSRRSDLRFRPGPAGQSGTVPAGTARGRLSSARCRAGRFGLATQDSTAPRSAWWP